MKLSIELLLDTTELEKCLIYLNTFYETHTDVKTTNEAHKYHVKVKYDKYVKPRVFYEGDLLLVYNQTNDTLGARKFVSMCRGPYIVKHVLGKRAYELVDYERNALKEPRNGLYLKKVLCLVGISKEIPL